MTAITLPSNTVWVTDDLAVAVVPGEYVPRPYSPSLDKIILQWVAPREWARYDKPCETCGGTTGHPDAPYITCADCFGGRQVWELRTESSGAVASGASIGPSTATAPGSVPLGRFTLQVVPVVTEDRWDEDNPPLPCVVVTRTGKAVFMGRKISEGWGTLLNVDPLPVPGRDFVLVVRKVTP